MTQLNQCLGEGSLADVVRDSRLFSSAHKYMAVRRVANSLSEKPIEALNVLKSYQADILDNRNMLAHAKEHLAEDRKTILRSIKSNEREITIDDSWMTDFRTEAHETQGRSHHRVRSHQQVYRRYGSAARFGIALVRVAQPAMGGPHLQLV